MDVVLITGVPGVGVSSVASRAVRELDEFRLFNFGDAMLEEAVARGIADDREDLSGLSLYEQNFLQRRAAEYLRDEASDSAILVNTRFIVRTPYGFMQGLPDPVLHELNPDSLVLVEADPDIIAERRDDEPYRKYSESLNVEIEFHQQMNRIAGFVYSSRISSILHQIINEESPEEAAGKLERFLD